VESQPSPLPKKKKARPIADSVGHHGPTAGSVGHRGPVFFSDPEDKESEAPEESYDVFIKRTKGQMKRGTEDKEPEAPEESYDAFIKRIKSKMKPSTVKVSDDEDEYGDEEEQEYPEEAEDDEEDEDGYVKEESRVRYNPRRGNRRNKPPCDNCIRKGKDCITQDSSRSRRACYNCGKLKQKCIFSVSQFLSLLFLFIDIV
jgi:hypothetical protein